ncbi:hypothetical protein Ancab_010835 [Ancistrocladus abbreviatus]
MGEVEKRKGKGGAKGSLDAGEGGKGKMGSIGGWSGYERNRQEEGRGRLGERNGGDEREGERKRKKVVLMAMVEGKRTRSRQEDQRPLKRIKICPLVPPAPIATPTPFAPSPVVHAPATPSSTPLIATLSLRLGSSMPYPTTIGSPILDHLIDEIELASCIDVLAEGDVIDAEAEINDPIAIYSGANDDA